MRVRALVAFAGRVAGSTFSVAAGQEFDLPEGVDWLAVGLVAALPAPDAGALTVPEDGLPAVEHAVSAKRTRR